MICDAEVDHREGKHHAGCSQRPRRQEDVHVSIIPAAGVDQVQTSSSRVQLESNAGDSR